MFTLIHRNCSLSDTTAPDVILAKAKMILNKLSVTNFHKLSDEFMGVGIDSEDLMGRAVEMIVVCAQVSDEEQMSDQKNCFFILFSSH